MLCCCGDPDETLGKVCVWAACVGPLSASVQYGKKTMSYLGGPRMSFVNLANHLRREASGGGSGDGVRGPNVRVGGATDNSAWVPQVGLVSHDHITHMRAHKHCHT